MTDVVETVKLGSLTVPRLFNGLWQLSSPGTGRISNYIYDSTPRAL